MAFRDCYHKDCPTPKIYVTPFVPKTKIASITEIPSDWGIAQSTDIAKTKTLLDRKKKEDDIMKMKPFAHSEAAKISFIHPAEEYDDYIMIYCDSNHKNIIPIEQPPESKNNIT